jgi:hypothetical protein
MSTHHTATDVYVGLVTDITIPGGVEVGDTFDLAEFSGSRFTVEKVEPAKHPNRQSAAVRHANGHTMAVRVWTS